MSLDRGTRLGPYEIVAPLGAGGMGEVYRARDARLQRDVAIKVLPAHLASDPVALARFEREARSIAALSHPHILSIFDFGRDGSTAYAVTELLEGRTLRDVLLDGPLPSRRAIEVARQIADGLAAAHQKDIVHRDLKPENVFMTRDGSVKVLDFGLARSQDRAGDAATMAATAAVRTGEGTVLGTVGYMAPEQVRGQDIDYRADIFAFGAVLYEMLSGRRAFSAETSAETMTAILRADPPKLTGTVTSLSPAIERLTRRCLEKDREHRFQSARDLGFALDAVAAGDDSAASSVVAVSPRRLRPVMIAIGLAAVIGLATGVVADRWLRTTPAAMNLARTAFSFEAGYVFGPAVALSPDGRLVAYTSTRTEMASAVGAGVQVEIRRLDALDDPPVTLAADSVYDWSSDSRYLLASTGFSVLKFDVVTGERSVLGQTDFYLNSARWLRDGDVLIDGRNGLSRLRPGSGSQTPVVEIDPKRDSRIGFPSLLPDGVRFLYVAAPKNAADGLELRIGSLDPASRDIGKVVAKGVTGGQFIAPDALAYIRARTLYVQPFDPVTAELTGEALPVARDVFESTLSGASALSVTRGMIAYRSERFREQAFVWVDRTGRVLQEFPKRDSFSNFDLSPRGDRVAVTARRGGNTANELWLLDLSRGIATNISEPGATHSDATWSPDGERLAFRLAQRVVTRAANGGPVTPIFDRLGYPETWSPDGTSLILGVSDASSGAYDMWLVDAAGKEAPSKLITGQSLDEPRFSPDGRWVAFNEGSSDGRVQIQVIPFPATGQRFQLSVGGGSQPRWRSDGRELYFLAPDGGVMAVQIPDGDVRRASVPVLLFHANLETSSSFDQIAPAPDGQRFLLRRPPAGGGDRSPVHLIVNFDLQRAQAEAERQRPGR